MKSKLSNIDLIKKLCKCSILIMLMINEYPYKYYPKEKYQRRRDRLEEINKKLWEEIRLRNLN